MINKIHETLTNVLNQSKNKHNFNFNSNLIKKQLIQLHGVLYTSGLLLTNSYIPSKLIYLFASIRLPFYSHRLLRHHPDSFRSVVDSNTVIRAYSNSPTPHFSLVVFLDMLRSGLSADHFSFPFLFKACSRLDDVFVGMSLHCVVLRMGFEKDLFVANSVIHCYAALGRVFYARKVFDEMPQRSRVSWNSMIDGYAKCGEVDKAVEVFECMPEKDVVSWTSVVDGMVKAGEYTRALGFFESMLTVGMVKPNEVTMVSVLRACAHLGALQKGKVMHCYIVEKKLPFTLVLLTSLVDMYAKCGAIEVALDVFRGMLPKVKSDVFLWNAVIGGVANHGCVKHSLELFEEMLAVGVVPDEITYLCLLSACAHGGLVKEAWRFFEDLERNGMTPKSEHYACMVDVMAKAGAVEEAYDFLSRMPLNPTPATLGALLSGCMKHGRLDLAELVGKKLVEVDPHHDGRYVGLSNVYAAVKRWDDAKTWRKAMDVTGVKKVPGFSYVEISGIIEMFKAHDRTHRNSLEIYDMVNLILLQMRKVIDYDEGSLLCY